jgi:6-phosphogluconate dehydrogenase
MKLAMIGLGKMGGNMAARLLRNKIDVVGFDFNTEFVNKLVQNEGLIAANSVEDAVKKLEGQKIVWMMLPAGEITEKQIKDLIPMLNKGDIIVDGGNSNYKHSQRRGAMLAEHGIGFVDCGTSGGVWGLDNGYCLMYGGDKQFADVLIPAMKALAHEDHGWAHVGPVGSGHFTKMIHNGIEYGMMQAFAEGLDLIKGKKEFDLDLAQITELWRHGSVVRSWLLDLTAEALKQDQSLQEIAPYVADSGEGRWTVVEAVEQGVAAPVLTTALQARFRSQDAEGYSYKLLSLMRNAFGGHAVKSKK